MDKKKIAVFATGWAHEILYKYVNGAKEGFEGYPADLYLFLCHTTFSDTDPYNIGELNIFNLPDLEDFDGVIVAANTIDFPSILEDISARSSKAGIPVVYTGNDGYGGYFVGSDNYVGARALSDHLIEKHGARKIFFVAGTRESMDSNTRLKALRDAMEAKGMELPEEDIVYTNWGPYEAAQFAKKKIDAGDVPDAFVCANDTLAMILCRELEGMGYPVPKKCIVTGFDNEMYAQYYDPVISSVDQRFDLLGKKSAETLIRLFRGEACEKRQTIPCEFVVGESCGCESSRDYNKIRRDLGRNKFMEDTTSTVFDQNLFGMERSIKRGKCYQELKDSFRAIHTTRKMDYQGYSFHVVLDPLFEQAIYNQERRLREKGYSPVMDAVFSVVGEHSVSIPEFETRKLVPLPMEDGKNHQYMFLPLHEAAGNIGYLIFCDSFEKIREDNFLRKYVERMSISLWSHLRDLQLSVLHSRLLEMTETDALTHVKNRTAYRARKEKLDAKIRTDTELSFAVAVFDVNNLKKINDGYGHEAGDDYIISACRMICKIFKKSAVYRIGGDEFVVVLENEDYDSRDRLISELNKNMEDLRQSETSAVKRVSIAAGLAEFDQKTDEDYASVFNRADAKMYENKMIMKKQLGA